MAAEVESMAFSGETPWHTLGEPLTEEEAFDVRKAIVKAGLNWEVRKREVFYRSEEGLYIPINESKAVVRETDGKPLGVVGNTFTPLQNAERLAWFQPWLDAGLAKIESAMSLRGGKVIAVQAKLLSVDPIEPQPGDPIDLYALLSGAFDGTMAERAGLTPRRVVCMNTLRMAHQDERSQLVRVRHSAKLQENLALLRECIDVVKGEWEATAEQYRFLASKDYNQQDVLKYIKLVFGFQKEGAEEEEEMSTRASNIVKRVEESVEETLGHNWWSAYNGVTRYLSHERGHNPDTRVSSLFFGESAKINDRALALATEFAEAV